jgi:molybdopterin-containing oxidoreductase family iron-sulfur binding subunit
MSNVDQCPSTTKGEKKLPSKAELALLTRSAGTLNGKPLWRSAEEVADTPEFREFLHREFPSGASELSQSEGETRRDFLKLMGASLALAGAATVPGCRQPDHKIMPYSKEVPEEIIPGKPLYYATSFPRPDGGAEGLLVETHEGRPTKIEGNPLHPINQGKCSTWALASIMGMYDPERLKFPVYNNPKRGRVEATWDDFRTWSADHFKTYDASGGEGLAFICDKKSSPSRQASIAQLRDRFKKATWVSYSPTEATGATEGSRMAFGKPMREVLNISKEKTRVILTLDRDFLYHEAGEIPNSRQFASARLVLHTKDDMSRLYSVESAFTLTGAQADHRLCLSPSRVTAFVVELAKFMLPRVSQPGAEGLSTALSGLTVPAGKDLDRRFLEECAKDLLDASNRGRSLILAGDSQPPEVHALVIALNAALGNIGQSVGYVAMTEEEAAPSLAQIGALATDMKAGKIKTLVCIGTNPVYDAPADTDFAALFAKVPTTICLSVESTETAATSTWSLNAAHYLESWSDTLSLDGTLAPIQPMIAPLYEPAMSDLELISYLANKDAAAKVDGYEIVRGNWKKTLGGDFDRLWRRALHDGVVAGTGIKPEAPSVNYGAVATGVSRLAGKGADGIEVVWYVSHVHDGRYANCSWLHELPEVGTRTVWDNPVLMSPKTAEALNLTPEAYTHSDPNSIYYKNNYPYAKLASVKVGGNTVTAPVWILPGMADNVLLLAFGYGRESAGVVADGVGVNMFKARASSVVAAGGRYAQGATIERAPGEHMIASTQNHWSMEGRTSIVRAQDIQRFKKFGDSVQDTMDEYDQKKTLNFAEQLGELAHTPANRSIYENPYNKSQGNAAPGSVYSTGPQWGMTIDQTTCTGCGACTIACQGENNIAVVGKKEVAKGREMHWIRVDRYYTGEVDSPEAMLHQPVACVHCENAPCETVCPVNATIHGPEGINYMTYNRCIGTRYCANNCPYKVRRFNFFDYGVTKFNGNYFGKEIIDTVAPDRGGITGSGEHNKVNPNLIPPRLRQKLDEISRMQKNPDVTVRSRGVMEKCSYCIQRINAARIETKLANLPGIPEGFFQTACQQACPSNSIVFGDTLNKDSQVSKMKNNARSYQLLGYINTRPRTSHMVRLMNPNENLVSAERKAEWNTPLTHEAGEHGEKQAFLRDDSVDSKHNLVTTSRRGILSLRVLGARA